MRTTFLSLSSFGIGRLASHKAERVVRQRLVMYQDLLELNRRQTQALLLFSAIPDAVAIANAGADATFYGAPTPPNVGGGCLWRSRARKRSTKRKGRRSCCKISSPSRRGLHAEVADLPLWGERRDWLSIGAQSWLCCDGKTSYNWSVAPQAPHLAYAQRA
jgi:hypothetical protein